MIVNIKSGLVLMVLLFSPLASAAGTWVNDKSVVRTEVRDGSNISVLLDSTDGLCVSERVFFHKLHYIDQEGVNQSLSILMAATMANKTVSILVEKEASGNCYGRIITLSGS